MSIEEEASALLRVPPFKSIPANRLKLLAFASQLITPHAGTVIIRQDLPGESAYVLLEGSVKVEIEKDGVTKDLGELEPYAFADVTARYVRIVGHGNTANAWNSLTEVEIHLFHADPSSRNK